MFQYFITVVPTRLNTYTISADTHQFSVTERVSKKYSNPDYIEKLQEGCTGGRRVKQKPGTCLISSFQERVINHAAGSHGVSGIFVKYDTSSLMVTVSEQHMPLWQFLVRLCGIIGGIFSTTGKSGVQLQMKIL